MSANGVVLDNVYSSTFTAAPRIHYVPATQLVYADDGSIVNPASGLVVGTFDPGFFVGPNPGGGFMVPDSTLGVAFFLGQTRSQINGTTFTVESFDLTQMTPISSMTVEGVLGQVLRFIRWGPAGLAFNDNAGYVYLIDASPLIPKARLRKKVGSGRIN